MSEEVLQIFEKSGAVLHGHFLLSSGLHSPEYWEKVKVIQHPEYTEKLCRLIADHFRGKGINAVAGPTTPGIILAYETARQLGVRGLFAEKDAGGGRVFRPGFRIEPGESILVVDDILTTGGSVREVIAAVKNSGARVVGVGVLVDRSTHQIDFGVPFFACHRTEAVTYSPESCPLCASGLPLVRPGSSAPRSA